MISVVIPAFNEEKYIRACVKSLQQQDYTGKYEVVVVDNGSQDQTRQVALQTGARVITFPRKGVAYARQAGAEAARGEIVVQADADTTYPVWWLRRIQRQLDSHPQAVAVAGSFVYSDPPWWAGFEYVLRVVFGFLSNVVFGRPLIVSGANFAFYKKALLQIGGYRQDSYSSDQLDISGRLRKLGKIYYDIRSYGFTSSRSVAKPTWVVTKEFIQNLNKFSRHTTGSVRRDSKTAAKKEDSASPGTYINIALPVVFWGALAFWIAIMSGMSSL